MTPEEKQRLKNKKKAAKEKKKILKNGKYICEECGFIGKPAVKKYGTWAMFFVKLAIVSPIVSVIVLLSAVEGVMKLLTTSGGESLIWQIGFEKFFPAVPYKLYACRDCKKPNSMKKISSPEGTNVFDRFDREHFLTRL
jgi:hypothetical protein